MKKLIILLTFILAILGCTASAADFDEKKDLTTAMNLVPVYSSDDLDSTATKQELAYATAKLMNSGELVPVDTQFTDVKADNLFSGYIEFLRNANVVNGNGDSTFNPESPVTTDIAYKMLINTVGYAPLAETLGGYPAGYQKAAISLGITSNIDTDEQGYLTKRGLINMVYDILTAEYGDVVFQGVGQYKIDNDSDKLKTLLNDRFNVNYYDAYISEVDTNNLNMTAVIEKSKMETNRSPYKVGKTVTFAAGNSLDVANYENVPVSIYAQDGKIIYIKYQTGITVEYLTIDSVNGDTTEGNTYAPAFINKISFMDDKKEYSVTNEFTVRYNNEYTEDAVSLIGNFAKVVMKDKKIRFVEAWDLNEGGLLKTADEQKITFVQGSAATITIKDVDYFKRVLVYIDGKSCDYKQFTPELYFDYYKSDDTLVLVASEKIITDYFHAYSSKTVTIGNISFDKANRVYVCNTNGTYELNGSMNNLVDNLVDAFFNYKGQCKYIRYSSLDTASVSEFLGALGKVGYDDGEEKYSFEVWSLEGTSVATKYIVDEKTRYNDGLTIDSVIATKEDTEGSGIYLFKTSASGKITEISNPTYVGGCSKSECSGDLLQYYTEPRTIDNLTPYVAAQIIVGGVTRYYYRAFTDCNDYSIYALYLDDDNFAVKKVNYANEIRNRTGATSVNATLYGYNDNVDTRCVVLSGVGIENLSLDVNDQQLFSVLNNRSYSLNKDGDTVCELECVGNADITYKVMEKDCDMIPDYSILKTTTGLTFGKSADCDIYDYIYLGTDESTWEGRTYAIHGKYDNQGFIEKGVVKAINNKSVLFDNGLLVYFKIDGGVACVDFDRDCSTKNYFLPSSIDNIEVGDTIYYLMEVNAIRLIVHPD